MTPPRRPALLLALLGCTSAPSPAPSPAPSVAPPPNEPHRVHVDRTSRTLSVVDQAGRIVRSEAIGIGRGGLGEKTTMADFITPTGDFTVDLVLHRSARHNAVSGEAVDRFSPEPELLRLLEGEPGLEGLYRNMGSIDFDGDGAPDNAYGEAYVGLDSPSAVTGPKMRRHSKSGTAYWYSIALHGTPDPDNLGQARSGGCVHVSHGLLESLIRDGSLAVGSRVTIADGGP